MAAAGAGAGAAGMGGEGEALTMAEREQVERDTDEIEDVVNVLEFLLPAGSVPADASQFSLSYNKRVLDGWVRQPSACCGAASVSGAWNALGGLHRADKAALTHSSVLLVYRDMFFEMIARKTASFERKLGAKLLPLLELLRDELAKEGKTIGGKRAVTATKKSVSRILRREARARLAATTQGERWGAEGKGEGSASRDALDCIVELFLLDGVDLHAAAPLAESKAGELGEGSKAAAAAGGEDEEEYRVSALGDIDANAGSGGDDEDEDEKEAEEGGGGDDLEAKSSKSSSSKANSKNWDWLTDLMAILKNIGGLKKICAPRPSTALIGNWGIQQAVERLSELAGLGSTVRARLFMGKAKTAKSKLDAPLTRADGADAITAQWDRLRAAFNRPRTVLLFHLKNHYALLHALREWTVGGGGGGDSLPVRQILTARKGQRPTAWISFDEAREQMLGWEGYKIILIERDEAVGEAALSCFDRILSLELPQTSFEEEDERAAPAAAAHTPSSTKSLVSLSPDQLAVAALLEAL